MGGRQSVRKKSDGQSKERLDRWTSWATIAAAVVTIGGLLFGVWQFYKTQDMQREMLAFEKEAKAVELYDEYTELQRSAGDPTDAKYWTKDESLAIAEAIYYLVGDDKGWRLTIKRMVEQEAPSISNSKLDCGTFGDEFIEIVQEVVGGEVCG